ncbi:MAG TPA: efflux RND transporter periplasmic adaptor subunit [Vicinamibacterales bacterium]|nr:efflux RND transporter periplasmic adaptor subunit [Vicinamibacterales bacterium]
MTSTRPARILTTAAALLGTAVLGAGGMYVYLRSDLTRATSATPPATPPVAAATALAITLTPEAVSRAGIATAPLREEPIRKALLVPGIVGPNEYAQVVIKSVAAGQVRTVLAELGAQVKRGELLATIHSPELAETQRMYLSMASEFDAAHQRLTRLEGLVKIGAASQQELETARAEHTRHATDVESARATLALLGVTDKQISSLSASTTMDATVHITSPRDGMVTARAINPGANIDAATDLFTVADLGSVWVVANLYERDLASVQVGDAATIRSTASGGRRWTGRVSYVDPQLAADTRAAKARIEVSNPDRFLRFGMYVDVTLSASPGVSALVIPRTAVQTIGSQTVVYVADGRQAGRFAERSVALGATTGDSVEVLSGVAATEQVVVAGSFALRAERDRLGLPPPTSAPPPVTTSGSSQPVRQVEVAVTKEGFVPVTVTVDAGVAIDLVFIRRTDETCAKEVVVDTVPARRALPLNQPVTIRLPPSAKGTLGFVCGMNMLRGTVVVR